MPDNESTTGDESELNLRNWSGSPDERLMAQEEKIADQARDLRHRQEMGDIDDRTLSTWSNRLRQSPAEIDASDLTIAAAALLILRWLETVEEEAAAIAEFEESSYDRCLTPAHELTEWRKIPIGSLADYLKTTILPELTSASGTEYAVYAQRLVAGIEIFARIEATVQHELVEWIVAIDPSDSPGKMSGERFLQCLLDWAGRHSKSLSGAFLTPDDVAWLMVKTANPAPNSRVYDPCFGTGNLLAEAANWKRANTSVVDSELWAEMNRNGIYGREMNGSLFLIGLARVVYRGVDLPRLELGDSLESDRADGQPTATFDCIVANPPFGLSVPKEIAAHYPVPMTEGEGLFLQHIVDALAPGGRAVVLVSPGILSARGKSAKLRQHLVEANLIDEVIGLPAGVLKPYSSVSPALLVLRKDRAKTSVRFSRVLAPEPEDFDSREISDDGDDDWKKEFSYKRTQESLAHFDFDLRVRSEVATGNLFRVKELATRYPEVELISLGELCQVIRGVNYRRQETTDSRADAGGDNAVGLVRISDIVKGEIQRPALYLLPDSPQCQREGGLRSELEAGDLVLSIKGTIGKLASVPKLKSRVAAASGIAVLRPEHPSFLVDYLHLLLSSSVYRDLLLSFSAGTTLQHIRHSDLAALPIPVPPIQIQDHVSLEVMGSARDAFVTLERILQGEEKNPFIEWLEQDSDLEKLLKLASKEATKDRLRALEAAARSIYQIFKVVGEQPNKLSMDVAGDLDPWLNMLAESSGGLRYITKANSPGERFSGLQSAWMRSLSFELVINGSSRLADRARQLSKAYLGILSDEIHAITKQQQVSCDCADSAPRNEPSKATVSFFNHGPLALTDVRISELAMGSGDGTSISHWAANEYIALEVDLDPAFLNAGQEYYSLTFTIESELPDGSDFFEELPCSVLADDSEEWLNPNGDESTESFRTEDAHPPIADLGTSPYNAGSPVRNEHMLYGREPILRLIKRQLSAEDRPNVILLEGNRRTGKTSILKRLEKGDLLPDWEVIYCSLQNAEGSKHGAGIDTKEVWRTIAKHIGQGLIRSGHSIALPGGADVDPNRPLKVQFSRACREAFQTDYPFEVFQEFLEECLDTIQPKRLLLMLDEFDKLQEGIDSGVTSPQVPENLRNLIHDIPTFCAILTGSRRLKRLREEYWSALFGFGHREGVSALSTEDAKALVREPIKGRLTYTDDAISKIVTMTSGHPFLIQSICNTIFESAAEEGWRKVNLATVESAAEKFLEAEHFRHFWELAETWRRKLILTWIQRGDADEKEAPMTLPLLEEKLADLKVPIPQEDSLGDDLKFLLEFEMIRLIGTHPNQHYAIEIPIFGEWIETKEDYENTLHEAIREGEKLL